MEAARTSYLDYNATTPLRASARAAAVAALETYGNPSSVHRTGREARALVEDAREAVAAAVGAKAADVVFTSGATEANALALRGLASGSKTVFAATTEHPSVLAHVAPEHQLPVDGRGVIDLKALEKALAAKPSSVVAVMAVNNETGTLQPVVDVVAIARKYDARVHCDAVQALGKIPVDMATLGVDSLALSGHKVGAAKGVGALALRPGLEIAAQSIGGGQERRRRAGTENTLGIATLGAVAREVDDLLAAMPRIAALRDRMEKELSARVPAARILSADADRVANTTCAVLSGVTSETQIISLDLARISVSAGAACSSGKVAASHVLLAMGMDPADAGCALRVSLGWETTDADVDHFLKAYEALARKHLASAPAA